MPKYVDKERKFQTYKGNNLAYHMLCEHTCLYKEEKEGYNISGDFLINLKD